MDAKKPSSIANHSLPSWIVLSRAEQVDELIKESNQEPIVIFKHSTRCIVSRTALRQFEMSYTFTYNAYFLDLLSYRSISNQIADILKVTHQSPQVIVAYNGQCIFHLSHDEIDALTIETEMAAYQK